MQKSLFICLICLIWVFQYQLTFGNGGALDNRKIQKQIELQRETNSDLEARNNKVTMKIIGLKGSSDFLEARARQELNLIKPNEILVLLPGHAEINK